MEISVRNSTLPKMLEICKKHKRSELHKEELEEILEHDDYKVEFDRYNSGDNPRGGFSKEEYVEFFMNLFSLDVNEIKNERLKLRYKDLKYFFDHLDYYEAQVKRLNEITEKQILEALKYTFKGLPESIKFERLDFIFSVGLGNSGGWFHKSYSHYDIVHYLKAFDLDIIMHTIAHEIHHVGFLKFIETLKIEENLTPEENLFLFLAFEGLAVKYCNNGEGNLTSRIYKNEVPNIGLDKLTWNYLNSDFDNIFNNFKTQVKKLISKETADVNQLISDYWLSLHSSEQDKSELPKLKHSRNYSLGNNLWGLIHDVYGKEKVFETIQDLSKFTEVLNPALERIGRKDLNIMLARGGDY